MKFQTYAPLTIASADTRRAPKPRQVTSVIAWVVLIVALSHLAAAASLDLTNDPATGAPGKFAAEEICREAVAKGMAGGDDARAIRVSLTVGKEGKAVAQSYRVRVQNDGGRRTVTVRGADEVDAMYGGLDIAEAIRTDVFDSLKDSDHTPYIKQRGIKFNIPLDVRTPTLRRWRPTQESAISVDAEPQERLEQPGGRSRSTSSGATTITRMAITPRATGFFAST
jgi:hypothetical protein